MAVRQSNGQPATDRRTQVLKGALDLCVLAVLQDGPNYGYGLVEALKAQGLSLVAEGSVYPLLTRLEKRGLVTSKRVPSEEGPPRKYYSLTVEGGEVLAVGRADWLTVSHEIAQLLGGSV